MNKQAVTRAPSRGLMLLGILAIATVLRVTFTSIAPLLDDIRTVFQLSTAQTGFLTTLPLLAFAVVSPLAARLARGLGIERSLLVALIAVGIGIGLRSAGTENMLWLGTLIIGCGIALGNVLLPALIKRDFADRVARITGAYSLTMGIAAAIGSALMVPVAAHGGWQQALLVLLFFPLAALLLWLPQVRRHIPAGVASANLAQGRGLWRSSLAWQVTLFLGLNSLVYYVVIGWLPSILVSNGFSPEHAGSLHGLLQLATAAPGLFIGVVLARLNDQRAIAAATALLSAISMLGLWLAPALAPVWVTLFGFGAGATMILGLTFIGLRASSAHQAAALSGMAQSIGYLLAAFGPPLIGKLHDISGHWSIPLGTIVLFSLVMAGFGVGAGRNREIDTIKHRP
ncbi:MFS transporter [Erwinia sp. HR93]|uniref:MFS transporter n=1 Tax=Erwinia sp. HR93 TaxID=3094840 RepID=UPI002ADEFC70|nr:MFS transporter [Erwinia sp. HR93]MEA1064864.1 MFS transporter [Erwinia sp. HR93]